MKRIETSYQSRGLTDTITQYDAASSGSVTDELQYAYDDWGNLASFTQDVDSVVGGGGRGDFGISYTYAKATPTNGRVHLRRTGASYPGGSDLAFSYPSAGNVLNDAAGWTSEMDAGIVAVATYAYDGSGAVVEYTDPEPPMNWTVATGSSYSKQDNFGRVTQCNWRCKSQTFYDVAIAYDRDSNITSVADAIRKNASSDPNYDAAYTIDGLNRLTLTDEGKLVTGAIASGKHTRYENWTLDQVGNWSNYKLDLTGGNSPNYSDAGEFQEDRTTNVANELTKREQDTNATAGYENTYNLSYDDCGNTTDDGKDYTYVWDAFGRLRYVKTRGGSPVVVEEHRYNGLGYRIGWHYDVNASGGAPDGSDPWYYSCFDERWRAVATFRGSDSDPKERFVYHAAGFGGFGGSSYIDAVVLRDRDANTAWTSSADGVLEERRYYCQNWRADVSAILTDTGKLVESVKYSSYGVPIGLPAGDLYGTGTWSATESSAITAAIGGAYDVRFDTDLDGSITSGDVTQANAIAGGYQTLGRAVLSSTAIASRLTRGGYGIDSVIDLEHIRTRWSRPQLGLWLSRDSLFDVNLYGYCLANPLPLLDPLGEGPVLSSSRFCKNPCLPPCPSEYTPMLMDPDNCRECSRSTSQASHPIAQGDRYESMHTSQVTETRQLQISVGWSFVARNTSWTGNVQTTLEDSRTVTLAADPSHPTTSLDQLAMTNPSLSGQISCSGATISSSASGIGSFVSHTISFNDKYRGSYSFQNYILTTYNDDSSCVSVTIRAKGSAAVYRLAYDSDSRKFHIEDQYAPDRIGGMEEIYIGSWCCARCTLNGD